MKNKLNSWSQVWERVSPRLLPFADAATPELPLGRLLRLSLFQVSVGMAVVLLNGTLNRVMIVELNVPAFVVALMVSVPLLLAPIRALLGYRSDNHRSYIGWRRVPYLWFGSMLQFGGLAIMPFALILLSGDSRGPEWVGTASAALAFLLVGLGMHTTQTAGLALATDLAPESARARVVALLYVCLLIGMLVCAVAFSGLLANFSQLRLIQVIQGAAVLTIFLNVVALWKQEPLRPWLTTPDRARPGFMTAWRSLRQSGRPLRLLTGLGLGTAGFSMQDILLEPYGGQIMGLPVAATTLLTALLAAGMLAAVATAAAGLKRGHDPHRLAGVGALIGIVAFSAVIFSAPLNSAGLFQVGTALIGFGSGLFGVGTLTAAMELGQEDTRGMALGVWGAVQALAMGSAIAVGGALRDVTSQLAVSGALGAALTEPVTGYMFVYHVEIGLLFGSLIAIGPLVRVRPVGMAQPERLSSEFGLAEFPG